jgi:V8-like Glu-specific endopeptidase
VPAALLLRSAPRPVARFAAGAALVGTALISTALTGTVPLTGDALPGARPLAPAGAPALPARTTLAAPSVSLPSVPPATRTTPRPSHRAQVAIRTYWTPARMAAARPGEQLAVSGGTRFSRSGLLDAYLHRLGPARVTSTEAPEPGAPWTRGGTVARTTGKVFFSLGADDYVCSGSAVSSPDRSTVLTAGHCVYDPESSTAATNWAFVPGYADGKAPYGVFPARHLVTSTGWRGREDFDVDFAFADVGPNGSGVALTDAVGGQPIAFGAPRGGLVRAFGYPAAAPWTGERLVNCAATVVQDTSVDASQDQGMRCSMTPGSSGGPWLAGFSSRTGRGTLVSVTSFSYSDQPGVLWGPYLGSTAKSLYTSVASAPGV